MTYVTVTPANGRDYKSAKAAREDWNNNLDFILQAPRDRFDGKPINKRSADAAGLTVHIRYGRLRKIIFAEVK
jgi:hypothetical protein